MKLLIISLVIVSLMCTMCTNNDKQKFLESRIEEENYKYQNNIKESSIPSELLKHFPEKINSLPIRTYKSSAFNNCVSYMLSEYGLPSLSIDSIAELYKQKAKQLSFGNDSNLVVVKSKLVDLLLLLGQIRENNF